MKVTSIKNVLIWALVLVNLLFIAFYLRGLYADSASRAQSLRDLGALYARNGITLSTGNIGEAGVLQEYVASRNETDEKDMAEALLGNTSKTDAGGNTYDYTGEKGKASFSVGGKFDVKLNPGVWPSGSGALSAASNLLETLKISSYSLTDSGGGRITAICAVGNEPVFNRQLSMNFTDGSLVEFSGTLAANLQPTANKTDMSSAATALVSFLSYVRNSDAYVCSAVLSAEPGYLLVPTSVPGNGRLQPVWRIETDAGVFYYNTVTGTGQPEKT